MRTIKALEDHADEDVILSTVEDVEIEGIDDVFREADEMRDRITASLKRGCGVDNAGVAAGGIKKQAFWGWDFVVHASGEVFGASIELEFEDGRCFYTAAITQPTGGDEYHSWDTSGECATVNAVKVAFDAFSALLKDVVDEESEEPSG